MAMQSGDVTRTKVNKKKQTSYAEVCFLYCVMIFLEIHSQAYLPCASLYVAYGIAYTGFGCLAAWDIVVCLYLKVVEEHCTETDVHTELA